MSEEGQMICGESNANSLNSQQYITAEFTNICKEYTEGKFSQEEKDLEVYINEHKLDVMNLKVHLEVQLHRQFDMVQVLKLYIAKTKTINAMHENKKQMDEIFKECYFRWKQTNIPQDAAKVALDWARLHAPGWRDHEIHGYIFLVDQKQWHYRKILEETSL